MRVRDLRLAIGVLLTVHIGVAAAHADTVRVLAGRAAVHVTPDPNSITISTVSAGTVLDVESTSGAWYSVWLPADPDHNKRLGYLSASDAELIASAQAAHPSAPPSRTQPVRATRAAPAPDQAMKGAVQFETFGGSTLNLSGSRAIVTVPGRTADSGDHKALPSVGVSVTAWLPSKSPVPTSGVFFDFSGVDGGQATASIGSASSSIQSAIVDFHGGWVYQAHSGSALPYVEGGIGGARVSQSGNLVTLGFNEKVDEAEWHLSELLGGGVRVTITERTAIRGGIQWLAIKAGDGWKNYGRLMVGFSVSSAARP